MATYRLTGPDGSTYNVTAPDDVGQDEVLRTFHANLPASAPAAPASYLDKVKANGAGMIDAAKNTVLGAVRGAGSIGATLMAPLDAGARAVGVDPNGMVGSVIGRTDRRQAMTDATQTLGADTESLPYKAGKLGAEVAGTAGAGGFLAQGARGVGAAPEVVNALRTYGFTTGSPAAAGAVARNLAIRSGAGAAAGGAQVGLADPEHAGSGALIGGLLPPALKVAGPVGEVLANGWRAMTQPRTAAAAQDLAKALGAANPEQRAALLAQLKNAPDLISSPTVAQALQTPEASILQRVVHDSAGGGALRDKIAAQSAARTNALEGVAPTAANGLASAREDLGQTVARQMIPARAAEKARVSGLYEAVDPAGEVKLQLPLDEIQAAADKYAGPGVFGQGGATKAAVRKAQDIGTQTVDAAVTPFKNGSTDTTLGQAVRALGVAPDELKGGFSGEVRYLKESKFGKNLVNKNGRSLDQIAERMHEDGFLNTPDVSELVNKLSEEAGGSPVFSRYGDASRMARDRFAPDVQVSPGRTIPVPVDWRTLQDYRSSVGSAARQAGMSGANRDAAALNEIKNALSGRIDQAAGQGLLKEGENFPADAYARWTDANAAHAAMKNRFDTGALAGMFRTGRGGEPVLQGGEIAARAWGARPGLADDVKSFKRLVGENPELLGQFKSMVTTEGAATADAAGNLTTKFSKWVDKTLPGLKETFSPAEVQTLQRIAQDIDRHAAAVKLGTSLGGSNTYQNAANALSLGVLDSPAVNALASRIPIVGRFGGAALDAIRGSAKNAKAERLAELLADRDTAVSALGGLDQPRIGGRLNALAGPAAFRAAPRAGQRN